MQVRELEIAGAWVFTPRQFADDRGAFMETFKAPVFQEAIGHRFDLAQVNLSVSRAGVVRGIHFADVPPSQAKFVTCPSGRIVDVIVDIRVGSPTYGQWEAITIDSETRNAVYLSEGLGHAFAAITDQSVVTYMCSQGYSPEREHGISPVDSDLGIDWKRLMGVETNLILSQKDSEAPTLAEARAASLLPTFDACQSFLQELRTADH